MVNNYEIGKAMTIKLDNELPPMPKFVEGIRRAPKREFNLSKKETEIASKKRFKVYSRRIT